MTSNKPDGAQMNHRDTLLGPRHPRLEIGANGRVLRQETTPSPRQIASVAIHAETTSIPLMA